MGKILRIATAKEARQGEKIENWKEIDDGQFEKPKTPKEFADSLAKEANDIEQITGDMRPIREALSDIARCPEGEETTKALVAAFWLGGMCGASNYRPLIKAAETAYRLGAPLKDKKAFKYGKLYHRKCMDLMKIKSAPQAQKEAKKFVQKIHKKEFGKILSNRQIQRYENAYLKSLTGSVA